MINILYENGQFWVRREQFGKTIGYAIYENDGTSARRVARIGFTADIGLRRAIAECDRRAAGSAV